MKKAAIACDDWKVGTFERILREEGYRFETGPGVTSDTRIIQVEMSEGGGPKLVKILAYCQAKCAELKN